MNTNEQKEEQNKTVVRVFLILRNGQQSPDNTHQWTSGHHVGEGSRCQVPAGDSQQGLQEGLELLQVVEVLIPGKHLNQTSSMRSKINTNKNEQKEKKNKKNCWEAIPYSTEWSAKS